MTIHLTPVRRRLAGAGIAVLTTAVLVGVMLPLRAHIDIAIVALVLVIPVVIGAAIGGFLAGMAAVVVGFLAYDLAFIPPYGSLTVGRLENWAALAVYVVVMIVVSRVVDRVWRAESLSRTSQRDTARLFELSELLVGDRPPEELFGVIVDAVLQSFGLSAVVLFLPVLDEDSDATASSVEAVARAGRDLDPVELAQLVPSAGAPSTLRGQQSPRRTDDSGGDDLDERLETLVLVVSDRIVGLLGIAGPELAPERRELLGTFANHIALAIERSHLRDQAVRVQLLEEVDRHRRYLFGAVSHDLRTPIATIKASASALLDPSVRLDESERQELAALVEAQADRLDRVVGNLLDMSRIQAGALVLDLDTFSVDELFAAALEALGPSAQGVVVSTPSEPLLVDGDRMLLVEALVNLLENALRYAPSGTSVELAAEEDGGGQRPIRLTVTDRGPGIPGPERARLFEVFQQGSDQAARPSGGSGLGLSISRAFVQAHGGSIRIEDAAPGATIVVELPHAVRQLQMLPRSAAE